MTKLCPRGKAAAKRKFRVYPSAYANAYASKICAGKIKDPSGVKRKDFKGRKPAAEGGPMDKDKKDKKENLKELIKNRSKNKKELLEKMKKELGMKAGGLASSLVPTTVKKLKNIMGAANRDRGKEKARVKKMGGVLMEATERLRRQGLKRGGRGCKLAMKGRGRAYGKNS